jgi:acetylornithine deacetylase/succinyl-diaminopimelate desuccinylase-like protein
MMHAVDRVLQRLEELYAIGGGPGANRIGYSPEEDEAHRLARGWMEEAGLEISIDAAGNLIGRHPERGQVWTGSHLDSVPNGGKYDGALGVVAGIEAVEKAGAGTVVAFRDEERGCAGSRAFAARPMCYLELHVEQGPVLAEHGAPLGVVTGIAGLARGELVVVGRPGHAGTVPMEGRDDALVSAAELVLRIRDTARGIEGAVATIGRVEVEPGALNVIPGQVALSVDARAPDAERFERLIAAIGLEPTYRVDPVSMSEEVRAVLRDELERRGLPVVELSSGAGHDAGILAGRGIQSGMLFVRSLNGGASHSPDELSSAEDIALGVEVLAAALSSLGS